MPSNTELRTSLVCTFKVLTLETMFIVQDRRNLPLGLLFVVLMVPSQLKRTIYAAPVCRYLAIYCYPPYHVAAASLRHPAQPSPAQPSTRPHNVGWILIIFQIISFRFHVSDPTWPVLKVYNHRQSRRVGTLFLSEFFLILDFSPV